MGHNLYRSKHQRTNPLTLDEKLCEDAAEWANYLAKQKNRLEHCSPASERNNAGENLHLYEQSLDDDEDVLFHPDLGDDVVKQWYKEIDHWSFKHGSPKRDSPPNVHT